MQIKGSFQSSETGHNTNCYKEPQHKGSVTVCSALAVLIELDYVTIGSFSYSNGFI